LFVVGGRELGLARFTTVEHAQYTNGCLRQVAWRVIARRVAREHRPVSWGEIIRALEQAGVLLPLLAGLYVRCSSTGDISPWTTAHAVTTCELLLGADLLGDDRLELARLALSGFRHLANNSERIRELASVPLPDVILHFPTGHPFR
jgi:hypothetical protein